MMRTAAAPLSGVRVLDLSRLLPGPYCSLVLADMGADVVKIEDPAGGDYLRWMPPSKDGVSLAFAALNRGKRSCALDLRNAEHRDAFLRLCERADVVLESFRPGVMTRLGCGWDVLRERNPRLVYCAISGYGQTGPYSGRAGHDIDYLALSGLLGQNAVAGQSPAVANFQAADVAGGGLWGALRIAAALFARDRSGEGAFLDVSMTEGVSALLFHTLSSVHGGSPEPAAGTDVLGGGYAFYGVYETGDGRFMALGALEPKFWSAFCAAVGHPEWVPRQFETGAALRSEVEALFRSRSRAEWEAFFAPLDVCCEPVLGVAEAVDHPAVRGDCSRSFTLGGFSQLRTPVLDPERVSTLRAAPALGEHTTELLAEAGITLPPAALR